MSKVTKKRLCAILASLACILSVLVSSILVVNATVSAPTWSCYPIQGYTRLGYVVYDGRESLGLGGRDLALVDFPLSPSSVSSDFYADTSWDSQFYYSNYIDISEEGEPIDVSSRIEYLQNSDGDIPTISGDSYDVVWGDFDVTIPTRILGYRQQNKAMMGNIDYYRFGDPELGLPTGYWSTLFYELGDIYYWHEETIDDVSDNQTIRQVITIPYTSLGTEELDMGATDEYDYADLVYVTGVAGSLVDVGSGERYYNRDVLSFEVRPIYQSRVIQVFLDVELPEGDDFVGHLFKLEDCVCEFIVYRGGYNEIDNFNVYVDTGYNIIDNIDEVQRSLQGQSKIEIPNYVDIGSWLAKGVSGFFDAQIAPGISLGGVLAVFVAFGVTMYLIKLFLGG